MSARKTGFAFSATVCLLLNSAFVGFAAESDQTLNIVIMDPLAKPLSCPCVEGYAQRDYEKLADYLRGELKTETNVVFAESLKLGLEKCSGQVDVIIGKDSVVRSDAEKANLDVAICGRLTDRNGETIQRGLIVVNRDDPAKNVADLAGYKIIFGPAEAAEKHEAALEILADAGIDQPAQLTIDEACSDSACKVIDLGPTSKTAAVISSYAQPLLEGCGTIKKGDLRVVAETDPVPFIAAFVNKETGASTADAVADALTSMADKPALCMAVESAIGFIEADESSVEPTLLPLKKK
jgi:ABC-type phosphate/phosphonate transport system substrate-binding protein